MAKSTTMIPTHRHTFASATRRARAYGHALWTDRDLVVVLVGAVVMGVVAMSRLARPPVWSDEADTWATGFQGWGRLALALRRWDSHAPLYFLAQRLVAPVVGASAAGMRALSVVAATATVPIAFLLYRRVAGRFTAFVAVVTLVANPVFVRYATEARNYAMSGLLSTLAFYFALDSAKRRTTACVLVLAVLTHLLTGLLTVAAVAIIWLVGGRWSLRRIVRTSLPAIGVASLMGVLVLHYENSQGAPATSSFSIRNVGILVRDVAGNGRNSFTLVGVLVSLIGASTLIRNRWQLALLIGAAVDIGLLVVASSRGPYLVDRYAIAVLPALALTEATGLIAIGQYLRSRWHWRRPEFGPALAASVPFLLLAPLAWSSFRASSESRGPEWSSIVAAASKVAPVGPVVFVLPYDVLGYSYFATGHTGAPPVLERGAGGDWRIAPANGAAWNGASGLDGHWTAALTTACSVLVASGENYAPTAQDHRRAITALSQTGFVMANARTAGKFVLEQMVRPACGAKTG